MCLLGISIHALLAESDCYSLRHSASCRHFYPRSPCGERRVTVLGIQHRVGISIHALLAESDSFIMPSAPRSLLFLSTLSLRRATQTHSCSRLSQPFLSTLSLRRATQRQIEFERYSDISIHALLAESDTEIWPVIAEITISIHALLAESDCGRIRQSLPR